MDPLVSKFRPTIVQGFRSLYDLITPIHLGDFVPDPKPTIYYAQRGPGVLYCLFHRKDWSEWPRPFRSLDEHEFDFEGVFISPEFSAAVFHHQIKITARRARAVFVQPGGHGIEFGQRWQGNWIYYRNYNLLDICDPGRLRWLQDTVQPAFNTHGVSMPWQWADGALWTDPMSLKPSGI